MKIRKYLFINEKHFRLMLFIPIILFLSKIIMRSDGLTYYAMFYLRFYYSIALPLILYFHYLNEDIYSNNFIKTRETKSTFNYIITDILIVTIYTLYITIMVYIISVFGLLTFKQVGWDILYLFFISFISGFTYLSIYSVLRCFFKKEICYVIVLIFGAILSLFSYINVLLPMPNTLFNIMLVDTYWCKIWIIIFLGITLLNIIIIFIRYKTKGEIIHE